MKTKIRQRSAVRPNATSTVPLCGCSILISATWCPRRWGAYPVWRPMLVHYVLHVSKYNKMGRIRRYLVAAFFRAASTEDTICNIYACGCYMRERYSHKEGARTRTIRRTRTFEVRTGSVYVYHTHRCFAAFVLFGGEIIVRKIEDPQSHARSKISSKVTFASCVWYLAQYISIQS